MRVNANRVNRTVSRVSWLVKRNACFLALIAGLIASVGARRVLRGGRRVLRDGEKEMKLVVKWLEEHNYRILSIDHIAWCVYHGKFNLYDIGGSEWLRTVNTCVDNGIIEELEK